MIKYIFAGPSGPGYLNIPISDTEKTSSYTLGLNDVGEYIQIGTGGSVVIPSGIFSQGDIVTIVNNTNSTVSITSSAVTAYIAGISTIYSSVTLGVRGMVTVMFLSNSTCYMTGNIY